MPVLHSVSDPIKRIADDNVHNAQNHKKTVKEIWNVLQKANIGEHHHQSCLSDIIQALTRVSLKNAHLPAQILRNKSHNPLSHSRKKSMAKLLNRSSTM